ncbi:MAG: protein YgfX [Burkholderiales bacterium]
MGIITLSKSAQLIWLLACGHLITMLVIWLLPLPFIWQVLLSALVVASLAFYSIRDALRRLPGSVVAIKFLAEGRVETQNQSGTWIAGSLRPGSFVAPYLTTLAYQPDEKYFRRHLIILPDMLDAESFRQLRVHLRWNSP